MSRARRLLLCLTAALAIVGGTGPAAAAAGESRAYGTAPDPAVQGIVPDGYTLEEFYEDYYTALDVVDAWWADHWADHFSGTYTPPQLVPGHYGAGLYNRAGGEVDAPDERFTCYGQVLEPNNAYYCGPPEADFVAFDIDLLLQARELGDAFIALVVAHEWAHAVAARLDPSLVQERFELQADCLAGAALSGAAADGLFIWETGDEQEIVDSLTRAGDLADWGEYFINPTTGERVLAVHGSPEQRIDSFFTGWESGVDACLPAA